MKIGIDARLINETGVGRYIQNLLAELAVIDRKNSYVIFLTKKSFADFSIPNDRWEKRVADVRWHTLAEQFVMPWFFVKERLDLVHIPYHNPPIFYPGKTVLTIHDLTILHFATGKATTLPAFVYWGKRLGYYLGLAVGLSRAARVITVSETTKREIMHHFGLKPEKVVVTYEGVDQRIQNKKSPTKGRYFLYVGNAYPHKNLELLRQAAAASGVRVVYVGKDDYFYKKFGIKPKNVTDTELALLYKEAEALVFPSLMEGFGLPIVEALQHGCPVIASDIPVFHELFGDTITYFNPSSAGSLMEKLRHPPPRPENTAKLLAKFSWRKMAEETLRAYEASYSLRSS